MNSDAVRKMLEEVSRGDIDVDEALGRLRHLPFEDIGFARVDGHRALRSGFPEVILGQGKTCEQTLAIAERIVAHGGPLLVTRVLEDVGSALLLRFPEGKHNRDARCFHLVIETPADRGRGEILVVSAGTSDIPVAEEAALTAWIMGNRVDRIFDAGVAGIHRILSDQKTLERAEVLIVVAGMEGALPSVVGGLVDRPIIAVPTSVGYGASFGGLAALLGMLNSCSAGVTVVNIDNGFGAGYAAALINRRHEKSKS
ncbi:MAG: nickel pincer cofactor biosynthesis protein LarB [Deltaproteobacteria bacterium]|nr:nickel pincer cofactor biosynthesis protein LarB [Deltaproteobacteria bacterium]